MRKLSLIYRIGRPGDSKPFPFGLAKQLLTENDDVELRRDDQQDGIDFLRVWMGDTTIIHGVLGRDGAAFLIPPERCDECIDFVYEFADELERDVFSGIGSVIGRPWDDE